MAVVSPAFALTPPPPPPPPPRRAPHTGQASTYGIRLVSPPANLAKLVGYGANDIGAVSLDFEVYFLSTGAVDSNFNCGSQCQATLTLSYDYFPSDGTADVTVADAGEPIEYGTVSFGRLVNSFPNTNGDGVLRRTGVVTITLVHQNIVSTVTVTALPGPAASIGTAIDRSSTQAGFDITVTVSVLDAFNNVKTDGSRQQVTMNKNTTGVIDTTIITTNGVGTAAVSSTAVVTLEIELAHASLTVAPSTYVLTIGPAVTSVIVFQNQTLETTSGGSVTVVALAHDQYGNLNTNEAQSVNFVRNGQDSAAIAFVNGVAQLAVTSATPQRMGITLTQATVGGQLQMNGVNRLATMGVNFTAVCDIGAGEFQDEPHQIECKTVAPECLAGNYQSTAPNATTDRVCSACDGVTEFQALPNQDSCEPFSDICTPGNFQSVAATSSSDRECSSCELGVTFSSTNNSFSCLNVTDCLLGEAYVSEPTLSADRDCRACPLGEYDADGPDLRGACMPCNPVLAVSAVLARDGTGDPTHYVLFTQVYGENITAAYAGPGAEVSMQALQGSCRGNRTLIGTHGPSIALVRGGVSVIASDLTTCSFADLAHEACLWAGLTPGFSVIGAQGIWGRGIEVTVDGVTECADADELSQEAEPTFSDTLGSSMCQNCTTCAAGSVTLAMPSDTSDQTCRPCDGTANFQELADTRFCAAVQTCGTGNTEFAAPSASSDRDCGAVTCPGLDAPTFGTITNCRGANITEDFLTECSYICPAEAFFRPVPEALRSRTCTQAGVFSGSAYECECFNQLRLDVVRGVCASACPAGFITGPDGSTCTECADACQQGEYEATSCDPEEETDRVCATCSTCAPGTWGESGCHANNGTDTTCAPFTECEPGFFVTTAGTPTTDRICSRCDNCVDGLYAGSGCCGTQDTECFALTVCADYEFVFEEPRPAPQGGDGTDRRCKVKKTACGTNEWFHSFANATHDMDCRACRVCPAGSYKTGNCTGTSDTICTPYTVCPTGQFGAGDSAFADITCAECSACSQSEYIAQPCDENAGTDTICMLASLCDGVTEYQSQALTASSDRECGNCSTCEADERVSSPCGTIGLVNDTYMDTACVDVNSTAEDIMCPRGQAPMGTNPHVVCVDCQPCDGVTEYAKEGAYCLDDPAAKIFAPRCEAVIECAAGFAEIAAPTPTSDRVCSAGVQCPPNAYSTSTRVTADVTDLVCIPDPPCGDGFFEIVPPTPQSPRQCTPCIVCPDGEYASRECTGSFNTACSKISPCATSEAVLRPAGSNTNTVCVECSDRVKGRNRPNDDPFRCVGAPPNTCPVAPVVNAPGVPEYSRVTFAMNNDFRTVVQFDPVYQHQLDDFTEQLDAYLERIFANWINYGFLVVSEGSIVASFFVTGMDNETTHTDAADAVVAILANGTFGFSYHGVSLSVQLASITVDVVDSSTGPPTGGTTTVPPPTVPTAVASTVPPPTADIAESSGSDSDSSDGLSHGSLVGIILAAVFGLIVAAGIVYVVYNKANESPWSGTNAAFNSSAAGNANDEYLNMGPDGDDGVFDSQLAGENARLQDEVDNMGRRIAEKNAVISEQLKAQRRAQETLEVAIAAKLAKENSVIQAEISAMKKDIKKKQHHSKFQKVAADQARLRAEKLVLEEEIARSDEVAQVALDALADYDTLQESFEEEENSARTAELERIQEEKARLAGEMQRLESRTSAIASL